MVNFKENVPEGDQLFPGGGGGGGEGSNCLFPMETHITCDFPGGGGSGPPVSPSGSALVRFPASPVFRMRLQAVARLLRRFETYFTEIIDVLFVLGMGRIIFDILVFFIGFLERGFFRKVNSLVMDGAVSQHWNELKNGYNPQDILEVLAIWEGRGVVLLFLWENVIEHLSAGQMGKIQNKIRIPIANI